MSDMRHPDSGWLMDYACGHLSPAFDIVIATHLLGCASCRADLELAERLATEVMLNAAVKAPCLSAEDILGSTRSAPDMPGWRLSGAASGAQDLTAVAGNYLALGEPALRWRGVGGGVSVACRWRNCAARKVIVCGCCVPCRARYCRATATAAAS